MGSASYQDSENREFSKLLDVHNLGSQNSYKFHNYIIPLLFPPSGLNYCRYFLFHGDNKSNLKRFSHAPIITTYLLATYSLFSFNTMLEPTSPMPLSQSNLSLCALDPSFITPAVVLSLHYHQFPPLLEHSFEHKTGGRTPISKTNPTPLTSHPVSSYYPMCQSGFSQGNITAGSDVGITGIRPHTIAGGPGEVTVQRRKLENPRKIINQAA